MVSRKLIYSIEENLNLMTGQWLNEVKKSDFLVTYKNFDEKEVVNRAKLVYQNLKLWLERGASVDEIAEYFEQIGAQRLKEGFPLTEVHYALYVSKKIFWSNIDWRDNISGNFITNHATEIMSLLNNYFDLGNFYVTRGYFHEMFNMLDSSKTFDKNELENILCKGKLPPTVFQDEELK